MQFDIKVDTGKMNGWAKAHARMLGLIGIPVGIGLFARYLEQRSIEAPPHSGAEMFYGMSAMLVGVGAIMTSVVAIAEIYKRLGIKV